MHQSIVRLDNPCALADFLRITLGFCSQERVSTLVDRVFHRMDDHTKQTMFSFFEKKPPPAPPLAGGQARNLSADNQGIEPFFFSGNQPYLLVSGSAFPVSGRFKP